MYQWNVEKCLKLFDEVYVSSEKEEILQEAKAMGAIPIKRPDNLCGDTPNIPVYQHALQFMGNVDGIVAVQANSPTIFPGIIASVKRFLLNECSEVMTCHPDGKIYGSVWAMTKERLLNYGNPYKPTPEVLLVDESIDIHTAEDLNQALCQSI